MDYLGANNIVHADLAARNVMVITFLFSLLPRSPRFFLLHPFSRSFFSFIRLFFCLLVLEYFFTVFVSDGAWHTSKGKKKYWKQKKREEKNKSRERRGTEIFYPTITFLFKKMQDHWLRPCQTFESTSWSRDRAQQQGISCPMVPSRMCTNFFFALDNHMSLGVPVSVSLPVSVIVSVSVSVLVCQCHCHCQY